LALALAGASTLLAAPALAADDHLDDALEIEWDGNAWNVPWDGVPEYETDAGDFFAHEAIAVPGDWVHRTLNVTNRGPCPGRLTVEILNPDSIEAADTVNHDDLSVTPPRIGFEGMSEIHWDVGGVQGSAPFSALTHGQDLATVLIGKDQTLAVQMAYRFPFDEVEGKHLGFTSQALTWDVGLRLRGETCTPTPEEHGEDGGVPSPGPTGPSGTGPPGTGEPTGPPQTGPRLPITGANVAFGAISAVFLIAAGLTAARGRRRAGGDV
jgi:hypothetical protein